MFMAISLFLAVFIWVTITDDLVMKSESQKSKHIQDESLKFDYKSEDFLSQVETYARRDSRTKKSLLLCGCVPRHSVRRRVSTAN